MFKIRLSSPGEQKGIQKISAGNALRVLRQAPHRARQDKPMINCLICGKEVSNGWITGLPPAPDSQKVGLCAEHDSPPNRALAEKKWRELLEQAVKSEQESEEMHHPGTGQLINLEILFIDGGRIVVPCKSFRATDEDTLEVTSPENRLTFYPMRHIRRYGGQ